MAKSSTTSGMLRAALLKPKYIVYCLPWFESEAGWGQRPDGYSLHISREEANQYIKDTLKRQKEYFDKVLGPGIVPGSYDRPGTVYAVAVDKKLFELVLSGPRRYYDNSSMPKAL